MPPQQRYQKRDGINQSSLILYLVGQYINKSVVSNLYFNCQTQGLVQTYEGYAQYMQLQRKLMMPSSM